MGFYFVKIVFGEKKGEDPFDVTMGSFDGAEVCELIGIFLLQKLSHININIGLYRDDGLGASRLTARQTEIAKKKLCSVFKEHGLKITIEANVKIVNFLDVTFNLQTDTYQPYMKPNSKPVYVHKQSNHPPQILKNIPESVNRRLSSISSNKDVFDKASKPYQEALKKVVMIMLYSIILILNREGKTEKGAEKSPISTPPFLKVSKPMLEASSLRSWTNVFLRAISSGKYLIGILSKFPIDACQT